MSRITRYFVCLAAVLLLNDTAFAEKLKLPAGMGGVPDIGAIPCEVFNNMIEIGPLGTKRSLLTWAEGYYFAKSGKTIDKILADAHEAGTSWDFDSLTGHFVEYCAADPQALTSAAVIDLGGRLLDVSP
jgi:hypothetical protein